MYATATDVNPSYSERSSLTPSKTAVPEHKHEQFVLTARVRKLAELAMVEISTLLLGKTG